MRRTGLSLISLLLAGCAGFEPRVSVQTHEPASRSSTGASSTPSRTPPTNAPAADYVVARGDTLYGIAFRNKLDFRDLAAWNNIGAPYTIYPGQGLRLSAPSPTTRVSIASPASTPTVAQTEPSSPATASSQRIEAPVPMQPVVEPTTPVSDSGDTQTFAVVDTAATAPAPALELSPPVVSAASSTPPPQSSTLPAERSPAAAIGLAPSPSAPITTTPAAPPSAVGTNGLAAATPSAATAPTPAAVAAVASQDSPPSATAVDYTPRPVLQPNAPTRARDGLRWRWPANGALIGRFVEGDPTQQGIDVGGRLGEAVLAAADGEVVYSGNGLIGYGELVIVQHSPGFLSAYGHNQKRLVLEGSKVKAGQPIAEMGRRGGIDMLHFEIRRNGKPVDPLGYLPQR